MGEEFVRAPDLIVERSSEDDSDSEQPVDLLVVAQGIEADIAQAEEDCPRLLHKDAEKISLLRSIPRGSGTCSQAAVV